MTCCINRSLKRRLLGVVYFYSRSNSPRLINDFDEGSDSVPGDGEGGKEREREVPGLFAAGPEEREGERDLSFSPGWGVIGGFLCALFRAEVLTEGP